MVKNKYWALLAVLAGAAGCKQKSSHDGSFQGIVELDERVAALEVPGRLVSIAVDEGSVVKAGEVIAQVDDSLQRKLVETREFEAKAAEAQAQLLQAGPRGEEIRAMRARLDAAKAREKQLKRTLERHRGLAGSVGASPEVVVDAAEAAYLSAVAERQAFTQQLRALVEGTRSQELAAAIAKASAAKSAAELESERLEHFQVRAPIDGVVVAVHLEAGEVGNPGTPVATIADRAHPFADVFVPQGDLAGIAVGTRAQLSTDAAGPVAGTVEYIEPRTEFTPRYIFSEKERPNLVVRVRIRIVESGERIPVGVPAFVTFEKTATAESSK